MEDNELTIEQIEKCLKDSGCSKNTIQLVIGCINNKDNQRKSQLLKQHRCQLLEKIHADQKQIDCLDYLLYQFKKEGE